LDLKVRHSLIPISQMALPENY